MVHDPSVPYDGTPPRQSRGGEENKVKNPMFKRVLIANRGEIAIRIARAASALGVDSVAVHAPADALSLHAKLATSAREIGAGITSDPVRAYLDVEAIIGAAKDSGSDCVHPGYGFLSENANFAERC